MCEGRKSYYVFDESSKGGNAGLLGAALDRCSCLITVTKLQTSRSFLGKVAAPRAACVRATPDSISLSSIHREQDPPPSHRPPSHAPHLSDAHPCNGTSRAGILCGRGSRRFRRSSKHSRAQPSWRNCTHRGRGGPSRVKVSSIATPITRWAALNRRNLIHLGHRHGSIQQGKDTL